MRPPGMSAAGQKKGKFGRVRAKTGQRHGFGPVRSRHPFAKPVWHNPAGVSRIDRCYEPCGEDLLLRFLGQTLRFQCL